MTQGDDIPPMTDTAPRRTMFEVKSIVHAMFESAMADSKPAPTNLQALADRIADKAGVVPVPVRIVGGDGTAMVLEGKDGRSCLFITQKYAEHAGAAGVLAHEIGHIIARDHTLQNILAVNNHPLGPHAGYRPIEDKADLAAVRLGHGHELVQALVTRHADAKHKARQSGVSVDAHYETDQHTHGLHRIAEVLNATLKDAHLSSGQGVEVGPGDSLPGAPLKGKAKSQPGRS